MALRKALVFLAGNLVGEVSSSLDQVFSPGGFDAGTGSAAKLRGTLVSGGSTYGEARIGGFDGTTERALYVRSHGQHVIEGSLALGVASPAQIIANQNDYNPAGLGAAGVLRLSSDAARTITGIAAPENGGRSLTIHNVGAFNLVLSNQDILSVAANRFAVGTSLTIAPDATATLWYDITTARWRGGYLPSGTMATQNANAVAITGGTLAGITSFATAVGSTVTLAGSTRNGGLRVTGDVLEFRDVTGVVNLATLNLGTGLLSALYGLSVSGYAHFYGASGTGDFGGTTGIAIGGAFPAVLWQGGVGAKFIAYVNGTEWRMHLGGVDLLKITSTGLAVTGTVSATSTLSGDRINVSGGNIYGAWNTAVAGNAFLQLSSGGVTYGYVGSGTALVGGGLATELALRSQGDMLFSASGFTERMRLSTDGLSVTGAITATNYDARGTLAGKVSFTSTGNGVSENARIESVNDGLTTNTGEIVFSTRNPAGTFAERARITTAGLFQTNTAWLVTDVFALTAVTTAAQTRTLDLNNGAVQTITADQAFTIACAGPAGKAGWMEAFFHNSTAAAFGLTAGAGFVPGTGNVSVAANATRMLQIFWDGTRGWFDTNYFYNGSAGDLRPT